MARVVRPGVYPFLPAKLFEERSADPHAAAAASESFMWNRAEICAAVTLSAISDLSVLDPPLERPVGAPG